MLAWSLPSPATLAAAGVVAPDAGLAADPGMAEAEAEVDPVRVRMHELGEDEMQLRKATAGRVPSPMEGASRDESQT